MNNSRARQLAIDDEEELIMLQESMRARQEAPAAQVRRIVKKEPATRSEQPPKPAEETHSCCSHDTPCSHHQHGQDKEEEQSSMMMMPSPLSRIMGEIKLRDTTTAPVPLAPQPASTAFPVATHRKQSKFALGRRAATAASSSSQSSLPPQQQQQQQQPARDETESEIDYENRHKLAAMSPEEVEEARAELLSKLPPSTVEFLKRRAASKAAAVEHISSSITKPVEKESTRNPVEQSSQQQPESAAARLRFNVSGQPIGLLAHDASIKDVLGSTRRDPLRSDLSEVYTLREACELTRSTVVQQRVVGLRLLSSVISQCRPDTSTSKNNEENKETPNNKEIWFHALHEARLVYVLRHAFDDGHIPVITAAAQAILALIGPSKSELEAWETADTNPASGWPIVPPRHLQRQSVIAPWVSAPAYPPDTSNHANASEDDESDAEPFDEKELAKVDPLGGLIHMSLIDRAVYILNSYYSAQLAAVVEPCLYILVACCMAGKDVTERVVNTPGFTTAMHMVLTDDGGSDVSRLAGMKLLRVMAQMSKKAASMLMMNAKKLGLVPVLFQHIFSSNSSSSENVMEQLQIEAFRFWRCTTLQGQYLLAMNDIFPTIHQSFSPDKESSANSWSLSREVYLMAAQLCVQSAQAQAQLVQQPVSLSAHCADAIVQQTVDWLLKDALAAAITTTSSESQEEEEAWWSLVGAAVHFLANFWYTQKWHTAEEKADVLLKLQQGGILIDSNGTAAEVALPSLVATRLTLTPSPALYSLALGLVRLESAFSSVNDTATDVARCVLAPVLSTNYNSTASSISTLIQPWDATRLQNTSHRIRAIAAACCIPTSSSSNTGDDDASNKAAVNTALNALRLTPPGDEPTALKLLSFIANPSNVALALQAASSYLNSNDSSLEALLKDPKKVSQAIVWGYAASWLGLIIQQEEADNNDAVSKTLVQGIGWPYLDAAVLRPQGSLLPMSPYWMAQQLPLAIRSGSTENAASAATDTEVGCALLWTLGLEEQRFEALKSVPALLKLKAVVKMVCMPREVGFNTTSSLASEGYWKDSPLVAIAFKALLDIYCNAITPRTPTSTKEDGDGDDSSQQQQQWTILEAKRLVETFASTSFGDKLFGAALVSTLLNRYTSLELQMEVLQSLSDGRALHLLPTVEDCPGSCINTYLASQLDTNQKEKKKEIDWYLKLLAEGGLYKCITTGSMAVSLVVHRLASYIFDNSEQASDASRGAVLCAVVRRCTTSNDKEALQVLSMLLRWDCSEASGSDSVDKERLEWIEQVCGVYEGMMDSVMRALEQG